ncbi:MAG: DegT/DnrJ/EryC1/StrS family aminotransferase [Candidatus Omnitrophota bacterium]
MKKNIRIPLLDLKKEYRFLKKSINNQLKKCLSSQHWILGEQVTQFEKETAEYLRVKHAIGVASGTDALLLALRALAITRKSKQYFDKKDEIITTPFTFAATAETIIRSGATPVFVDINPQNFNIDPEEIKKAINKNTVGILPVHLFGRSCEMDEIVKIAKENDLFIVEDVAQAFGAECLIETRNQSTETRKKLGTIGDCGCYSFFPSKNLGSYGDAGAIATNDKKIADIITVLRNHGQRNQYDAEYIGYNSRLDSIQAAVLLAKLKHIDNFNSLRVKIAKKYNDGLKAINNIQLPTCNLQLRTYNYSHVYSLYTIKVPSKSRDRILKFLNEAGIGARVYYPIPLHEMRAFGKAKVPATLVNANNAALSVLSLPINPFLTSNEASYIAQKVKFSLENRVF